MHQEQALLRRWIVVYGFNGASGAVHAAAGSVVHDVLRRFHDFGEIDDYVVGDGNWLCI